MRKIATKRQMFLLLSEINEYLTDNNKNYIGSGSKFHQEIEYIVEEVVRESIKKGGKI